MTFPKTLNVTDQEIDISGLSEEQQNYYEKLAERLLARYRDNGQERQVFFLAGPGGAGKSVVTALLSHLLSAHDEFSFVSCGIDAFHYTNHELEKRSLREVKGRYDTYDLPLLRETLQAFTTGEAVALPRYSRSAHEPIVEAVPVTEANTLWLLEGSWLLYEKRGWEALHSYASYTMFLSAPLDSLRANVTDRHIRGGRTPEDAAAFYETSDALNTKEILEHQAPADEDLIYFAEIS